MEVWNAYQAVKANKGSAGVDGQSIGEFDLNLKRNLYKIWNRMSSGSYFPPPVKRVEIPKADGKRPLGIPTVSDRVAQMVVKNRLEPLVEPHFHNDSYGYRPGKSAHNAVEQARKRCWRDDWVLDLDIKGFFEAIDHGLVMKAVSKFTQCKFTLLYIERWLQADVILPSGERLVRNQGTPQGGVISPLLANIFLHLAFDDWMRKTFSCIHFERYADDIVVHCRSRDQVEMMRSKIKDRLARCKLELSQEKSKIVYCKDSNREGDYPVQSFDFLGFTFRPRSVRDKQGKFFVSFSPAVSRKALKTIRKKIKEHPVVKQIFNLDIGDVACALNPVLQGWINYYGRFRKSAMSPIYSYTNDKLMKWTRRKYKNLQRRKTHSGSWLQSVYRRQPTLFAHWRVWNWVAE